MKITDAAFVQGFLRMCNDGWEQGWHERNGGNLSYRIKDEEIAQIRDALDFTGAWLPIGTTVSALAGEFFLVTGSGKYFRNVILDPEDSICIIELDDKGENYRICWGLVNGGRPTSELPSHLMNHEVKKRVTDGAHRHLPCAHHQCHRPDIRPPIRGRSVHPRALGDGDRVPGGIPVRHRRCPVDGTGRTRYRGGDKQTDGAI